MALNPITFLLKKLDAGLVDKASVKRIKELTDKYTEELKGILGKNETEVEFEASREALEAFTHDLDSTIKKSNVAFEAQDAATKFLEGKNTTESLQAFKKLTLSNHQFAREGASRLYNGHLAAAFEKVDVGFFTNYSKADTLAIAKGLIEGTRSENKNLQTIIFTCFVDKPIWMNAVFFNMIVITRIINPATIW